MYVQWASDQALLHTNTCVWEFLLHINTTQYSNGTCALHIPPGPRRSHCGPIIVLWVEGMWTNVVLVNFDINSLGGVLVTLDISSCTVTRWIVVGVRLLCGDGCGGDTCSGCVHWWSLLYVYLWW